MSEANHQSIRYEIIGRAVVRDKSDLEQHYLNLLYRGDGTPWWVCNAGMKLMIDPDFKADPGQFITISLTVEP